MLVGRRLCLLLVISLVFLAGCGIPKLNLFGGAAAPLKEYTLEGRGDRKILVIPVYGLISDVPREKCLRARPSLFQEVMARLRRAEADEQVKAVILKINSPGGTTTMSGRR